MKAYLFFLPLLLAAAPSPETELKDHTGKTIVRYVVDAPAVIPPRSTDPARQLGLFLCFQEHDTPTGNDIFPVRQALLRAGVRDGYVLLAAAPQTRKFGVADHEPLEKLIAWALKTYPINPRRIYMFGKGEGSKISMEFMMAHPKLVTAAIGYSWGAWRMPSETTEPIDFANHGPEIYLTLGRRDLDHHLTCVRDAALRIAAKGYHLIYREFDDLYDRSYHPPSNDDAIGWATRLRNKNTAPSAEETKLLKAAASAPKAPAGGYFASLALVGGAPAGAVLEKLLASPDAGIRKAAAETFRHGIFGPAALQALAKLTADAVPAVREAAIGALAMQANWRYPEAQKAIIAVATNPSATPEDRLLATDALGYAIRYQVKGVRQDPALFQALIALSQEKIEPLRASASLALAPAFEPGPAGSPRRRAPEGGWDKWLDNITATANASRIPYEVCHNPATSAIGLFCNGGTALAQGKLVSGFDQTRQAAEQGYVPAQAVLGMLYATGKGVEQNYAEAAKWWVKAARGGDLSAARFAWNLYRNGEGAGRDLKVSNEMAALIGEPQQQPRKQ